MKNNNLLNKLKNDLITSDIIYEVFLILYAKPPLRISDNIKKQNNRSFVVQIFYRQVTLAKYLKNI